MFTHNMSTHSSETILPQRSTQRRQYWMAGLIWCALSGCHSPPVGLSDDFFSDDASVQGRVTDLAGKPLRSIAVLVSIQPSVPYSYQPVYVMTDSLGRFQAPVFRVGRIGPAPKPDTLSAHVVAIAVGVQYKTLPSGAFVSDSVSVLLQFVPHNTPLAATATVTVRLGGL